MGDFTHCSGFSPSLIDHILYSLSLWPQMGDLRVLELVGSDHLPLNFKLRACIQRSEKVNGRSMCEERILKPVWIAKEKEENRKIRFLNLSEPAELDQAVFSNCK